MTGRRPTRAALAVGLVVVLAAAVAGLLALGFPEVAGVVAAATVAGLAAGARARQLARRLAAPPSGDPDS